MRIDSSGNVGIGTTSPGAKLEVNGDIISSGKIQLGSSADSDFFTGDSRMSVDGYIMTKAIVNTSETGSAPAAIVFGDGATFSNDKISLITAGQRRLYVHLNGDITIQQNLTVEGDISAANLGTAASSAATDFVAVTGDTMTGTLDVHVNDTGTILKSGNSSAANTPDQFFLKHNLGNVEIGNSRGNLNITSGNVGIGTTSPSQKLDVVGSIEVSDGIYIGGTAAANKLDDYEEGTYTPSITATGTDTSGFTSNGYYTKIGDIVHVEMRITKFVDEEESSKITNITLPFAANNTSTIYYKGGLWHSETYDKSNLYTLLRESTTNLTPYNGATNGLSLSADENNTISVNITYKAQ